MDEHVIEIAHPLDDTWIARCECGWEKKGVLKEYVAEQEGLEHLDKVMGG